MLNQLTMQADRANSAKILQFQHPVTKDWVDGALVSGTTDSYRVVLTSIPAGTYSGLKCRLKGSAPEISATFTSSVVVTGASSGGGTPGPSQAIYILVSGQSNALGVGSQDFFATAPGSAISPSPQREFQRVFIWTPESGSFQKLKVGTNNRGYYSAYGAEVGLAQRWENENATGNLYLIKHSIDGNAISSWDAGSNGYSDLVNTYAKAGVANLVAAGKTPYLAGFYWMQGESDAGSTTYKAKLQNLMSRLVSDSVLNTSAVRVIGKVRGDAVVADQDVQYVASDALAKLIDTAYYDMNSDNLHYSGRAQYLCGYTDVYNRIFSKVSNYPFAMTPGGSSTTPAGSGNENPGGSAETIVEESNTKLFYLTQFNSASNAGDSGGSRFANGDTFVGMTFSGPTVKVLHQTFSNIHIKYEIWIDGVYKALVDNQTSGVLADQYAVSGLSAGNHTIQLVSRASFGTGTLLYVDQFKLLGAIVDYAGPTVMPGAGGGPIGAGNWQPTNGLPIIEAGTFDAVANPSFLAFTGSNWGVYNNSSGPAYLATGPSLGTVEFNIRGKHFYLDHEAFSNVAIKYNLYLDEVYLDTVEIGLFYGIKAQRYISPLLVNGVHTIKLEQIDTDKWAALDDIRVA